MCESDERAILNLRTITRKINPHRPLGQCLSMQADWGELLRIFATAFSAVVDRSFLACRAVAGAGDP